MMIQKENIKEHNQHWPQITNHSYKILIFRSSGSGKTNSLFNLINEEPDIDKIYLHDKDLYELKYQFLINKGESTGLKHFNDSKAFIECLNDMNDIFKNTEEYNSNKKCKILLVFDGMIADMINNKNLNPVATELFVTGRKLNISLVLLRQKYIRLNSCYYFNMKIPNMQELQEVAFSHSSDIDLKEFMNLYKKCTIKKTLLQNHILF